MALWGWRMGCFPFVHREGGDALGAPRGVYQGAVCRAGSGRVGAAGHGGFRRFRVVAWRG